MKVLIIGASGLVGGALFREFVKIGHQVFGTYHHFIVSGFEQLDINDRPRVAYLLDKIRPEVILHPGAYANVDGCEKNPGFCRQVNVEGVKNVIDEAQSRVIPFIFFSTDYVFNGENGPYVELDRTDPLSVYGRVKLEIEEYLKKQNFKYLIVRTCGVFGWESQGKNFVVRLLNSLKNRQKVNVVNDQYATPTYAPNLAKAVASLIKGKKQGIYHIAGTTFLNRFDFSRQIAKVFKHDEKLIKPVTTAQINQIAKRPSRGGLKVEKVQNIIPFKLLSSEEGLILMKSE